MLMAPLMLREETAVDQKKQTMVPAHAQATCANLSRRAGITLSSPKSDLTTTSLDSQPASFVFIS